MADIGGLWHFIFIWKGKLVKTTYTVKAVLYVIKTEKLCTQKTTTVCINVEKWGTPSFHYEFNVDELHFRLKEI